MKYWLTMLVIGCLVLPLSAYAASRFLGIEIQAVSYVGLVLSILGIIMDRQDRIMRGIRELEEDE